MEALLQLLPYSIARPLSQLGSLSLSSSSVVPLLVSAVTLYFAVLSLVSTFRYTFRLALFFLKWGAIGLVLTSVWASFTGNPLPVSSAQGLAVGRTAWSLGSRGVRTWIGSTNERRTAPSGRRGVRDWDEQEDRSEVESIESLQRRLFSFLGASGSSPKKARKLKKSTRPSQKRQQQAATSDGGLSELAVELALGKARRMWDDLVNGSDSPPPSTRNRR